VGFRFAVFVIFLVINAYFLAFFKLSMLTFRTKKVSIDNFYNKNKS